MVLIHSWLNPKLEVRSTTVGKGAFAKESIGVGEKLAIFGGHIMRIDEEPVFSEDKKDFAVQIDEQFVIGTKYEKEIEDTDYFNYSCSPNAGFNGQIFLIAMRNIEPDEEITFDYAMVLHKPKDSTFTYAFRCHCGSRDCRGKVTYNDWKIPDLQKKYDSYFSWYLQERINKIKQTK